MQSIVQHLTDVVEKQPEQLQSLISPLVNKLMLNLNSKGAKIFIHGPTSVGKSAAINALCGSSLCPTGILETTQGHATIYFSENMTQFNVVAGENEYEFDSAEALKVWREAPNAPETNLKIYGSFPSALLSCASITDSQGVLHNKQESSISILRRELNGSTSILMLNSSDLHAIEHDATIEEISKVYTFAKEHNPKAKLIVFINKCDQLTFDTRAPIQTLSNNIQAYLSKHKIESIVIAGSAHLMNAIQLLDKDTNPIESGDINRRELLSLYNHYFKKQLTNYQELRLPTEKEELRLLLMTLSGINQLNQAIDSTSNVFKEASEEFIISMKSILTQELFVHAKNKEVIPLQLNELINVSTELGQSSLDPSFDMMNALTTHNIIEAKPGQFVQCNDGSKAIVLANEKSTSNQFPVLTFCTTTSPIEHRKLYIDNDQTYMAPLDSVTLSESLKLLENTPRSNAEWVTKVEKVITQLMPLAKYIDDHTIPHTNIHPENVITTVDGKIAILNSTQSTSVNRYPNDGVQMLKVLLSGTLFGYGSDSEGLLGYVQHTPQVSEAFVQWFNALKTGSSTCVESLNNLKNIGQNGHYEKYICTVGSCSNEVQSSNSKCSNCTSSIGFGSIGFGSIGFGSSSFGSIGSGRAKPRRYGDAKTNKQEYIEIRRKKGASAANKWARDSFGITFSGPKDLPKLRNKRKK